MGLIILGFIPSSWGNIVEYSPSWIEIGVTVDNWSMGVFIFTALAKVAIAIETGTLRYNSTKEAE